MSENSEKAKEKFLEVLSEAQVNGQPITVEWREGEAVDLSALAPKAPKILNIAGVLNTPLRWIEKRCIDQHSLFLQSADDSSVPVEHCHILVDRNNLSIKLLISEQDHYCATISGKLELHPVFIKFGINNGQYRTPNELADLIKMNRSFFQNHTVAMGLVSALKNFKATVNKEIEKSTNDRGDKRQLIDQVAKHNLPDVFNLEIPIFKGQGKSTIAVEVYVNPDDLTCSLVSPDANDKVELFRDQEIDSVLKGIEGILPGLVIIEQ